MHLFFHTRRILCIPNSASIFFLLYTSGILHNTILSVLSEQNNFSSYQCIYFSYHANFVHTNSIVVEYHSGFGIIPFRPISLILFILGRNGCNTELIRLSTTDHTKCKS